MIFQDISFAFQEIYPTEFTIAINETYLIFVTFNRSRSSPHTSEKISSERDKETPVELG